ncbi:MAG: aldehyde dehydrogenase [Paludibacteraceae bacterium]|nr:aldehyde dehydrogenase [Paludibacteraceae bacterium]
MTESEIKQIVSAQRTFFASRKTFDVSYRIAVLKKLRTNIKKYERELGDALLQDLGKSPTEGFMCETGMALGELSYVLRHVRRWARTKYVPTHLANFPSLSKVVQEPFGTVLVMSPWNYPVLLSLDPLIGAIAAGNTVVLKPSNYSPNCSRVLQQLLEETFERGHVDVITGGRTENTALLEQKFDYIFFTGSPTVGKLVMEKASHFLTPVTLELGGKSPVIIDHTANLKLAARRLCFGKNVNCGQTCIAPDYLLIEECVKEQFLNYYKEYLHEMYGDNPLSDPSYGKIVNIKHFTRVKGLIDASKVVCGGRVNEETLQIEPTVMDHVTPDDAVMQEEIFGPILPVLTWQKIEEAEALILSRPKPLACYVFTNDRSIEERFTRYVSYGGGCINDCINHIVSETMGFGGVGESGMGSYHGHLSFQTFSHAKSVLKKSQWIDIPLRYRPYKKYYDSMVHLIFH